MLVLSRAKNESIVIGDDIIVTVVEIRGDKCRLGVEAPKDVSVHRQEVYEAIQRENIRAARLAELKEKTKESKKDDPSCSKDSTSTGEE